MKYRELHRIIKQNGWSAVPNKGKGSHIRYTKNGIIYTVPYHGSKEIDNAFAKRILNNLGIEL
jgi:predicted RNA binding protein YcfA (HicA-like mRNA interferase family)